jgi:hypothetical protein
MTISPEIIAAWRVLRGHGMASAIGEYTPAEFWELLDEYEALQYRLRKTEAQLDGLMAALSGFIESYEILMGILPENTACRGSVRGAFLDEHTKALAAIAKTKE